MKLLIIRHADAEDADGIKIRSDYDRPLSEKGKKQANRLKNSLKSASLIPQLVLSSPLVRTCQTSELVFPDLFKQEESYFEHPLLKPGANPEDICKIIKEFNSNFLAIVGHMPDVAIFVCWLIGGNSNNLEMEKCGAALLEISGFPKQGNAILRWLVGPQWKIRK